MLDVLALIHADRPFIAQIVVIAIFAALLLLVAYVLHLTLALGVMVEDNLQHAWAPEEAEPGSDVLFHASRDITGAQQDHVR